jgi:TrmH family RNA methyltransferase
MLIRIESPDNGRLRTVRKLGSRKGRSRDGDRTNGRFVAEGINLVGEVISSGLDIDFIMASDEWLRDMGRREADSRWSLIKGAIASDTMTVCEVPAGLFEKVTDAGRGVGILAVVRMISYDPAILDDLLPDDNILILDRIQDPGNMGTMIRTAVAAGYRMIIAARGTVDIYSPKVLRATAGMVFDIPVIYAEDEEDLDRLIARSGRRTAVTVPSGGRPYYNEHLSKGIALIIGNEGNGASEHLIASADLKITLPMLGSIESLNAAVAAAILMYEAVRGCE